MGHTINHMVMDLLGESGTLAASELGDLVSANIAVWDHPITLDPPLEGLAIVALELANKSAAVLELEVDLVQSELEELEALAVDREASGVESEVSVWEAEVSVEELAVSVGEAEVLVVELVVLAGDLGMAELALASK